MKRKMLLIITMIIIAAGSAGAEDGKNWKGSGEIGLLRTTGNSENESVNAKAGLKYESNHLLGETNLAALYSSEETEVDGEKEDRTSAEKYNAAAKVGYKFTPKDKTDTETALTLVYDF